MKSEDKPSLGAPVTVLTGVGRARAEKLAKLGIETIEDLLRHYPRRYEDRRHPVEVSALTSGVPALVRVRVLSIAKPPPYARGSVSRIPMKVLCSDGTGELTLLFWGARWFANAFREDTEYWIYGTPQSNLSGLWMAHPEYDVIVPGESGEPGGDEQSPGGAGIVPIYPLTAGITQKSLRVLIKSALPAAETIEEFLPQDIVSARKLAPAGYALSRIHFPADEHALNAARYRLVYEELFLLQARLLYMREQTRASGTGAKAYVCSSEIHAEDAYEIFAFEPTGAQKRAIKEILSDMAGSGPMSRLLQGDVGSGKTAVAAAAAFFAAKSGFQTAIMAPTEILAVQHLAEFEKLFSETDIRVGMLSSGLSPAEKRLIKEGIAAGDITIAIGTHALIEPDVVFCRLGLVVTDEQHRFGVRQRLKLREKGISPDGKAWVPETLVMTATPIPRTLALMLYADLDVSVLDEMPPGRKPVNTRFIDSSKRDAAYDFAEQEIMKGRQVYVVVPMIGDSPPHSPQYDEIASVIEIYEELKERFSGRRVAALHGRMKGEEKEAAMREFAAGAIDMLVSTVVIEVGVNVPNATMMIIENAERFGLAQLHQLRGRVGRSEAKSYCVIISDSESELAKRRGEELAKEHDGFKIAELDLALRGPGDLFGVRQHGLPELKIADPAKHMDILMKANQDAREAVRDPAKLEPLRKLLGKDIGHKQ